ncbi:PQQ-binding-like beta-propeller repeat protein [Candidatus Leptofilum sp.]|uniref:outer membrane protein assembly factor BamB family protein n=1 Tax=Candidatus Leptofilum sp. TaxID=3241576 RepID=UPI003B5ABFFC
MKQTSQRRKIIGVVWITVTIVFACSQFLPQFLPQCYAPSTVQRTFIESGKFEILWQAPDVYIAPSQSAIHLVANEEHVVLWGRLDYPCGNPNPMNLNAIDGSVFRRGVRFLPSNLGIYHTAYNSNFLYLGYDGPGKALEGTTAGAGGVAAYKINSGEISWTRQISGTRGIHSLVANENIIAFDGGGFSDWRYLISSQTGEIIAKQNKREFHKLNLEISPSNFAYWYLHLFTNEDAPSQDTDLQALTFWSEKFDNVFQPPLLADNSVLLRKDDGTMPGTVIALHPETGMPLWQTNQNVISNVAIADSTAFFLTDSAELVAYNIESGQQIGSVQFSGETVLLEADRGYFVAAGGENVFVYFGDGRQLFAFHFIGQE